MPQTGQELPALQDQESHELPPSLSCERWGSEAALAGSSRGWKEPVTPQAPAQRCGWEEASQKTES